MKKVKLVTFVPLRATKLVRQALGEAGAGRIGEYSFCSFSSIGKGRFLPSDKAKPYSGEKNKLSVENEERIEVVVNRQDAKAAIEAMKKVHPYDEVAFDIYPLISENEL